MGCRRDRFGSINFFHSAARADNAGEGCASAEPVVARRECHLRSLLNISGCLVKSRLIGVIEGKQTKKGKSERNDRLLAVAESSHTHSNINSIYDLKTAQPKKSKK
jgi:hypothetical protein